MAPRVQAALDAALQEEDDDADLELGGTSGPGVFTVRPRDVMERYWDFRIYQLINITSFLKYSRLQERKF